MSSIVPKPKPAPPTRRVGPYQLCLELAAGGMGTVYLGHGRIGQTSHFAAIKVLHPHIAQDETYAKMFLDEGDIASRIEHPNVCAVHEVASTDDLTYLAMEYVAGETFERLAQRLRREKPDPASTAVRVAIALAGACEGLHAAHELTDEQGDPLGVVHRDVTPSNLMLTLDGVTKVLDFGVVAAAGKRHRTQTGILKGKLAYMAPELLEGAAPARTADVWSMGVVAWELMTGERLFRRDSEIDTLKAIQSDDVPAPSEVAEGIPESLDAVVLRALSRDVDERYPTARALGKALTEAAMREEVVTTGDLADWMAELFPAARERVQQVLTLGAQLAMQGSEATVHLSAADLEPASDEPSERTPSGRTPSERTPSERTPSERTPSAPPPVATASSAPPTPEPSRASAPERSAPESSAPPATPGSPRLRWRDRPLAAGALGAALALGFAWVFSLVGPGPRTTSADSTVPLPAQVAEPATPAPAAARLSADGQLRIVRDGYLLSVDEDADGLVIRIDRANTKPAAPGSEASREPSPGQVDPASEPAPGPGKPGPMPGATRGVRASVSTELPLGP